MFDQCDENARFCFFRARLAAAEHGGSIIELEHLILAILDVEPVLFERLATPHWTIETVKHELAENLLRQPTKVDPTSLAFSPALRQALAAAAGEAAALGHETLRPVHLLLGCLVASSLDKTSKLLADVGIEPQRIRQLAGFTQAASSTTPSSTDFGDRG